MLFSKEMIFLLIIGYAHLMLSFRLVRNLSEEGLPTSGNDIGNGISAKETARISSPSSDKVNLGIMEIQ